MNIGEIFDKFYNGEKNFFTPKVYGYAKKHLIGANYLLFEKSEGTGLFDTLLFSCSVLLFNEEYHAVRRIDLSKAFATSTEVEDYIKSINVDMAIQADAYGEVKFLDHNELKTLLKMEESLWRN